jgi:hypothetical protein
MTGVNADDALSWPPLTPDGEAETDDPSSLAEACRAMWKDLIAKGGWQLGTPLVTKSQKWGMVYRVDFAMPGPDLSPLINRLICWRTTSGQLGTMVAVGQHVPPLNDTR